MDKKTYYVNCFETLWNDIGGYLYSDPELIIEAAVRVLFAETVDPSNYDEAGDHIPKSLTPAGIEAAAARLVAMVRWEAMRVAQAGRIRDECGWVIP